MENFKKALDFRLLPFVSIICALLLTYLSPLAQNSPVARHNPAARQKDLIRPKRCPVNTINYGQGLMNNFIVGIITDAQGFTWVSTSTGLQRYNGYTLQTITPVAGGDTIQINYPVYFLEGRDNSILIGYKNGVLEFNPADNTFKKVISRVSHVQSRYALMPVKQTSEGIWC